MAKETEVASGRESMTGWALVVSVVGAVSGLVAAALSGTNLYLTGKRETKKWLRDALLEAQVNFLDASFEYPSRRLYDYLGEYPAGWIADVSSSLDEYRAAHARQNDALSKIRLLASDNVVKAAEELHKVDEKVAMLLFDQESGYPTKDEWVILQSQKRLRGKHLFGRLDSSSACRAAPPIGN